MIRKIKFLGIPVKNQDSSIEFYTKKLGFKVLTDQPFDEKQRWVELSVSGAETGIALFTPDGQEDRIGSFLNTALECDNIDKTYEELKEKGVNCLGSPTKEQWGSFFLIKDIDDNTICISAKK